jgi:iron complex transport system substrate-binding protein
VCAVPSGQVTDALDKLGCSSTVISLDPSTVGEVIDGIDTVARSAGVAERGERLTRMLGARVARVGASTAGAPVVRTAFLEWPDPPFSGGHWVPEMVEIAGGRDVLGVAGTPSRRIGWDEVASGSPEVVIYSPCGFGLEEAVGQAPGLFAIPEFATTPAARSGRVFAVDATSFFSRPGPRIVDGIEILAWALHPELFDLPPAGSIARVSP